MPSAKCVLICHILRSGTHPARRKAGPDPPGANNHPTLYDGAFCLDLDGIDLHSGSHTCFARLKVYTGAGWAWHSYPVKLSRYFETRWRERDWEQHCPKLILRKKYAALHFSQLNLPALKQRGFLCQPQRF